MHTFVLGTQPQAFCSAEKDSAAAVRDAVRIADPRALEKEATNALCLVLEGSEEAVGAYAQAVAALMDLAPDAAERSLSRAQEASMEPRSFIDYLKKRLRLFDEDRAVVQAANGPAPR